MKYHFYSKDNLFHGQAINFYFSSIKYLTFLCCLILIKRRQPLIYDKLMKSNTTPETLPHFLQSFTKAELTWCFIFNKTGINIDNTDGQYINKIYIWIKINISNQKPYYLKREKNDFCVLHRWHVLYSFR